MSGKRVVGAGCAHNTCHVETARPQGWPLMVWPLRRNFRKTKFAHFADRDAKGDS
jgi:hypothetical protein